MTNLPAQLSTLQNEISALTEKLSPLVDANVAEAIKSLLAAGLALPTAMNPDQAPAVYGFALKGSSIHGLKRSVAKIIRGEYKIHKAFIPNPPELATLVRAETQSIVDDLGRAKSMLEAREAKDRRVAAPSKAPLLNDLRVTHGIRADELARKGFVFIVSCTSHDEFSRMGKRKQVPAGSIYLWAIDEVWSPQVQSQAEQVKEEAA